MAFLLTKRKSVKISNKNYFFIDVNVCIFAANKIYSFMSKKTEIFSICDSIAKNRPGTSVTVTVNSAADLKTLKQYVARYNMEKGTLLRVKRHDDGREVITFITAIKKSQLSTGVLVHSLGIVPETVALFISGSDLDVKQLQEVVSFADRIKQSASKVMLAKQDQQQMYDDLKQASIVAKQNIVVPDDDDDLDII